MYAVIFRAEINQLDEEYTKVVARMRELAFAEYGCLDFCSYDDGKTEISISYWDSLEQINQWKNNVEHLKARERGRSKWYSRFKIEVTKIERAYGSMVD